MIIAEVADLIRNAGAAVVMPRFRSLKEGEVTEKSPGDLVTIADRECESYLSPRLREIRDIPVVGEEATAEDSSLLELVETAPAVWIVDPIDGTANFVAGDTNFAIMVALVEAGMTTMAWVWHPDTDTMLTAERGHGTRRNGEPVRFANRPGKPSGILKRKYMPEPARSLLAELPENVGNVVPAIGSAGIEYMALVDGSIDFLMYWRTLPWDHAPGSLIVQEAGLLATRLDGEPYRPGDGADGLFAATPDAGSAVMEQIAAALRASSR